MRTSVAVVRIAEMSPDGCTAKSSTDHPERRRVGLHGMAVALHYRQRTLRTVLKDGCKSLLKNTTSLPVVRTFVIV